VALDYDTPPVKIVNSLRKQKSEQALKPISIPKPSLTTLGLKKKKGKVLGVLGKRKFVYRIDHEKLRKM
jgi:hypothetical protein